MVSRYDLIILPVVDEAGKLLGAKGDCAVLRPLVDTELCHALLPLGQQVLVESQNLLRLSSYALYGQLAPIPLDERIWQLRSRHSASSSAAFLA